jgi:hypothetical protein
MPLAAATRPTQRVRRSFSILLVLARTLLLDGAPDSLDLFDARR